MSCETRHRSLVAGLLAMAGIRSDESVDTIIRVGHGARRRRFGPAEDRSVPVHINADVQAVLQITGHGHQTLPSWAAPLVTFLQTEWNRGNRRAMLTLQWIIGGWDAVTPQLTAHDSGWILDVQRMATTIPAAWKTYLRTYSRGASFGHTLRGSTIASTGALIHTIADALGGSTDVAPTTDHAVSRRAVLPMLLGIPYAARSDLHAVLRAVLDGAPVVAETMAAIRQVDTLNPNRYDYHPGVLLMQHLFAQHASGARTGMDGILAFAAHSFPWLRGRSRTVDAMRDPSPTWLTKLGARVSRSVRSKHPTADTVGDGIIAMVHAWRALGRDDAAEYLERCIADHITNWRMAVPLIVTETIRPPHGDAVIARLIQDTSRRVDPEAVVAAVAVYAAGCQQAGRYPVVGDTKQLYREQWVRETTLTVDRSSPIPLLAVGRERELLLPVIWATRDRERRLALLVDCIDAMDMLATAGGNTKGFRTMLIDVMTEALGRLDPRLVIRLAASRDGQVVLSHLFPTSDVPPPPSGQNWFTIDNDVRCIRHLASPWWSRCPSSLHTWWESAMAQVQYGRRTPLLARPPVCYRTIFPPAAVACSRKTNDWIVATYAVAHPAWGEVPDEQREQVYQMVFNNIYPPGDDNDHIARALTLIASAATDTAVRDIRTLIQTSSVFRTKECTNVLWFLDDTTEGTTCAGDDTS